MKIIKIIHVVVNQRIVNSKIYHKNLSRITQIKLPELNNKIYYSTFHLFIVIANKRNELIKYLRNKGIETKIHYPLPTHLQKAGKLLFKNIHLRNTENLSKKIISLPIHQNLAKKDIDYICKQIELFYKK